MGEFAKFVGAVWLVSCTAFAWLALLNWDRDWLLASLIGATVACLFWLLLGAAFYLGKASANPTDPERDGGAQ